MFLGDYGVSVIPLLGEEVAEGQGSDINIIQDLFAVKPQAMHRDNRQEER